MTHADSPQMHQKGAATHYAQFNCYKQTVNLLLTLQNISSEYRTVRLMLYKSVHDLVHYAVRYIVKGIL